MEIPLDLPGRTAPEDPQSRPHIGYCARCGGELYPGERIYAWDKESPDLCRECFLERVYRLDAETLAAAMGLGTEIVGESG